MFCKHFSSIEDEGIILSIGAKIAELKEKQRQYCNHDFEINFNFTYTEDARKKLVRIATCKKCKLTIKHTVEEPVDVNKID